MPKHYEPDTKSPSKRCESPSDFISVRFRNGTNRQTIKELRSCLEIGLGLPRNLLGFRTQSASVKVVNMGKQKALCAEGRTNWANAHFGSNQRKLYMYDHFLLQCPIPGVSHAGSPTRALAQSDNARAKQELDKLIIGIDCKNLYFNFELRQVAKWLIDNKYSGEKVPRRSDEFICMSITPASMLKKCYGLFSDKDSKEIAAADRNGYKQLLTLDAVYRHLRNSLAHGLYKEVIRKAPDGKRRPYLYLQDNNSSRQITARMFLSYERLQNWGEALDSSRD